MRPFIYDFKKTFLRLTSISLLFLFILSGVGIAFETFHLMHITPASYENLNVEGYVCPSGNKVSVYGIAFNNNGKPISSALVCVLSSGNVVASTRTSANGFFNLTVNYSPYLSLLVKYNGLERNVNISRIVGELQNNVNSQVVSVTIYPNIFSNTSCFYNVNACWYRILVSIMCQDNLVIFSSKNVNISMELVHSSGIVGNKSVVLKQINLYLKKFTPVYATIEIPQGVTCVVLEPINSSPNNQQIGLNNFKYIKGTAIYCDTMNNFLTLLHIFMLFLPYTIIYLAYISFSRPRSIGEMEFILARPITKRKIFISRFFSNALIAVLSSVLIVLAPAITFNAIAGLHIPLQVIFLLVLIPMSLLLTYLSITYMYSSIIKSSGTVQGLGTFTLLFLEVILPLIGISTSTYETLMQYITPASISRYIYSLIEGCNVRINVGLEITSTLLWIIIPAIISYLEFKIRDV
jgi:ABC-2 type transport system permease protein